METRQVIQIGYSYFIMSKEVMATFLSAVALGDVRAVDKHYEGRPFVTIAKAPDINLETMPLLTLEEKELWQVRGKANA